jgi:uncharacterized protein YfeS
VKDWFACLIQLDEPAKGQDGLAALVQSINSDPAWRSWWSHSGFKYLRVHPAPVMAPMDRPVVAEHRKQFILAQPSPELARLVFAGAGDDGSPVPAAAVDRAIRDTVLIGLDNAGKILGLGPGPGRQDAYKRLPPPHPQSLDDLQHHGPHGPHSHHDHADDWVFAHSAEYSRSSPPADGPHRDNQDEDEQRLLPAHPGFASHFRHRIYDADDYRNDDTMPFGTDEGADTVADWNDRADELRADTTLRDMLGTSADGFAEGRTRDDDDEVIAVGFCLLRFTGRIDAEGRRWMTSALRRQVDRQAGKEYRRMLRDLDNLPADPVP